MRNFFAFISKEKEFLSTVFIFVYDFQYLGSSVSSRRERAVRVYYELLKKI